MRHSLSRFQIPNEQVQQAAGQRQDGDNFETMGIISYQHLFSSNVAGRSARDGARQFQRSTSNPQSTPGHRIPEQRFQEGYFNGSCRVHHGRQEWKAGVESDDAVSA